MSISEPMQREFRSPGLALRQCMRSMPNGLRFSIAVGVGLTVGYALLLALQPPGQAIRNELQAAAGELHSPFLPQPTSALRAAIRAHFAEPNVDIDMNSRWPNVIATFHHVNSEVCTDAVVAARRIEDPVVIDLEGYRSPGDCRDRNEMRWWIRP